MGPSELWIHPTGHWTKTGPDGSAWQSSGEKLVESIQVSERNL
jgi:hypothetical protein